MQELGCAGIVQRLQSGCIVSGSSGQFTLHEEESIAMTASGISSRIFMEWTGGIAGNLTNARKEFQRLQLTKCVLIPHF